MPRPESWSLRPEHFFDGRENWLVFRDTPSIGKIDIGCIYQDTGARWSDVTWKWSLYRLHEFGILAGQGKDLEDCKKLIRAAFDEQVTIRGLRIVEEAIVPVHMRGEDWPWPKS